jgi:hypothetical protein
MLNADRDEERRTDRHRLAAHSSRTLTFPHARGVATVGFSRAMLLIGKMAGGVKTDA